MIECNLTTRKGYTVPHNDQGGRHTGKTPKRTFEHRLAGGNHRNTSGCFGAFLGMVAVGLAGVVGLAYAFTEAVL